MKRLIIIAISALIGLNANAQVFVGGSIGYQYDKTGSTNENKLLTASLQAANLQSTDGINHGFNITPEVGYRFNDKWAAGVKIGYAPTFFSTSIEDSDTHETMTTRKQRADQFNLDFFGRYTIWGINGFNICLQGELMGGYIHSKMTRPTVERALLTAVLTPNEVSHGFTVGVTLFPLLTYDITKHLSVIAEFNILGVSYSFTREFFTSSYPNIEDGEKSVKSTQSQNLISLNLNSKASLKFGIEYRF